MCWLVVADPLGPGSALGESAGDTHLSAVTLTLPLVVASFAHFPDALLLVMAVAYWVDFYVMAWAFGTPLFGVHAAVRVPAVAAVWSGLPGGRDAVIPAVVASLYLATVLASGPLRRRWLATRAGGARAAV